VKPLDFSALSWNDFVANAVFFIVDVLVLSVTVPAVLAIRDRHHWLPARRKVAERAAHYLDFIDFQFSQFADHLQGLYEALPEAFKDNPSAYTEDGLKTQGQIVITSLANSIPKLDADTTRLTDTFLQELQFLAPAFDSKIAIAAVGFYEAATRPLHLALAALNYWTLLGAERASEFGPPHTMQDDCNRSVLALENLCMACQLKSTSWNEKFNVYKPNASARRSDSPLIFGNHESIYESLVKMAKVLAKPLPPLLAEDGSAEANTSMSGSKAISPALSRSRARREMLGRLRDRLLALLTKR
jgi:hypothetical protein